LARSTAARGNHERSVADKKALKIALENHFVTPLTSLVVVQPNSENCKDYQDEEYDLFEKDEKENAKIEESDDINKDKYTYPSINNTSSLFLKPEDSISHTLSHPIETWFDTSDFDYTERKNSPLSG
ncbi:unnamed protein product, partial [Meganyctiphanes norvegica]